ncbi:putative Mg(2+) transport ATPase [Oxobacter pfennigii]|uniref:Putative Mg(2+) transport ATPase n=1 Tax=Oxobacter pfennigii TaxID=36849 RepID=A0A0P8Z2A1_9CLOT|nr:MgtC/SapB family protein [Oxobacter pfennigii]KPU46282.1 putative Mg(2+) transport ATPase [Oxobacter pfennigii]
MKMGEVLLRLVLAIVIGGLIGYEREFKNRPAGFRTHILVCIGAAVISIMQMYSVQETTDLIMKNPILSSALKADIGRMGAQVVSGVGFLGAGTIIHYKGSVKGLTTAASLWVVACIGLAVGHGYYYLSILSTASVYFVLVALRKVETRFFEDANNIKVKINYLNKKDTLAKLENYFMSNEHKIIDIEFVQEYEEGEDTAIYTLSLPRHLKAEKILFDLSEIQEILKVTLMNKDMA